MKAKITFLSIMIFSITSNGQTPIASFFPNNNIVYTVETSLTEIDQTPTGANAMWNFSNLTTIGLSTNTNSVPSAAEIVTFPNSNILNNVATNVNGVVSDNKIFAKNIANELSITGFNATGIELNFVTNNAKIGTFPLNYGYNFNDTTAGTFQSGTNSGTFTGTIVTSVDAYGTLNMTSNIAANSIETYNVTRIKTVQNINLILGFLPVGTIVQTTYAYFDTNADPQFRSTKIVVNIPLLSIVDQTISQMENLGSGFLSTNINEIANKFKLYPNPANDILNITNNENLKINALALTDVNGREIKKQTSNFDYINISNLQKGIYFLKFETEKGNFIEKIIKN